MGKSAFLSMLEYYYDERHALGFTRNFSMLDVGANVTPEHSSYLRISFIALELNGVDRPMITQRVAAYLESFIIAYTSIVPGRWQHKTHLFTDH